MMWYHVEYTWHPNILKYLSNSNILSFHLKLFNQNISSVSEWVHELADFLVAFHIVGHNCSKKQDSIHDNLILFLENGLALRNFTHSIHCSDSGWYLASLRYFTIWFQRPRQRNYANETIRLTTNLKHFWSPRAWGFFLKNSLINLLGRRDSWLPADPVNELVIR